MRIGIPKEIKDHEFRVGVTPAGVRTLTDAGHSVRVEAGAGAAIGFDDAAYRAVGADIATHAAAVYDAELIVKVKEPQPSEFPLLRAEHTLFCYLHLAADATLTRHLLEQEVTGVAYETVAGADGGLPLLTPMSEVAGRIAIQAGAAALQMVNGGNGALLGGVPGVLPGKVVILGAGTVGRQSARMAMGLGADVVLLDINLERLRALDDLFAPPLKTCYSSAHAIAELTAAADLVVGSVLIPGKRAPKLLSRETVRRMKPGAALVDVAIDQGGCAETSRPTTHSHPLYIEEGVVHYCVTNMPAACARTSTQALTNATLPYILRLAAAEAMTALRDDAGLRGGLNTYRGQLTNACVAEDLGLPFATAASALRSP